MTISVFDQAIALLNHPDVKRKLRKAKPDTAFVMGYMLAQVCPRCGDLTKYGKPGAAPTAEEPIEIKATLLHQRKKGKR